jgi:CRISPR-associated endonuclease/helicase Cas3
MTFPRLRAKSGTGEFGSEFLQQHLADVYHAAEQVLAATAFDQLNAVGLSHEFFGERLRRIVLVGAAVHDLGKANDHFQGMIYRQRNLIENPQGIRHEWVTLLMLQPLRDWLLPAFSRSTTDFSIMEWAVAGHHPGVKHASPPAGAPAGAGAELRLLAGHPDFRAALEFLKGTFALGDLPRCEDQVRALVGTGSLFHEIRGWSKASQRLWDTMRGSPDARLVAAGKACLIAADVAGSALPKVFSDARAVWAWIGNSFDSRPEQGDLQAVVDYRLDGYPARDFQTCVAASKKPITFVKAGCGSGKTLAAYMWAADNYQTRRLYFCYPTTGTATEGFRDYLFDPAAKTPRVGAKLFHSRADVDFDIILNAAEDCPDSEVAARLDALETWSTPVVSCTVDTVLGIVQNNKRGLFAWPALSQAAFVFDEIHAYDDRLFGALLRFVRDVPGVPVLLMTASLPMPRELALRELVAAKGGDWRPISGPPELERRSRYRREAVDGNEPLPLVRCALVDGAKVLWVCNTVKRVMDAAARADELAPIIYHSRFKYEDRVCRHSDVINRFQNPGPVLAICSQVAEMSLDLSADLLVTDLATVPAVIQRLGRLNRRAKPGDPTRPFVVVEPDGSLPYDDTDLQATRDWLTRLPQDGITQADLAAAWEQTSDSSPEAISCAWLDGGPQTKVLELRDLSPGITVLLSEDVERVRRNPRDLSRLTLPMPVPYRKDWRQWPREKGLPIAPASTIQYDRLRGALWAEK